MPELQGPDLDGHGEGPSKRKTNVTSIELNGSEEKTYHSRVQSRRTCNHYPTGSGQYFRRRKKDQSEEDKDTSIWKKEEVTLELQKLGKRFKEKQEQCSDVINENKELKCKIQNQETEGQEVFLAEQRLAKMNNKHKKATQELVAAKAELDFYKKKFKNLQEELTPLKEKSRHIQPMSSETRTLDIITELTSEVNNLKREAETREEIITSQKLEIEQLNDRVQKSQFMEKPSDNDIQLLEQLLSDKDDGILAFQENKESFPRYKSTSLKTNAVVGLQVTP
ncbi:probable DNA double-strand break repair Rad50 ATPase [Ptychodera flava]|uniref:probable DNA double-strand break repair Rad50 ATPase n=1 Tax=Ptychodera flava TaxID=63121 RepID=UPI00396AA5D3